MLAIVSEFLRDLFLDPDPGNGINGQSSGKQ